MNGGTDPTDRESFRATAEIFRKKWQPLVVQALLKRGPLGFSDLTSEFDNTADNTLVRALDGLRDSGIVSRRVISESPRRVEYELTDRGKALEPVVSSMVEWGMAYGCSQEAPTVVLADDDQRIVKMHHDWLVESFDVRTAHRTTDLIEALDPGVDVVVVERRFLARCEEDIVGRVRGDQVDARVVLLASGPPGEQVVDLDVDAYLVKPVERKRLLETVQRVQARSSYRAEVQEYLAVRSRLEAFKTHYGRGELMNDPTLDELNTRIDELRDAIDDPPSETLPEAPNVDRHV